MEVLLGIRGRTVLSWIVRRMGMASLLALASAPLYPAATTTATAMMTTAGPAATAKSAVLARMLYIIGTSRSRRVAVTTGAFHPNLDARSVQRRSSLCASRLRFLSSSSSSSFSSALSLEASPLDDTSSQSQYSSSLSTTSSSAASASASLQSAPLSPLDENYFLNQVETTVARVLGYHRGTTTFDASSGESVVNILDLPRDQREAYGVARHIDKRLRSLRKNNDCPRCWMQRRHCICGDCIPVKHHILGSGSDSDSINNNNNSNSDEAIVGGGGSGSGSGSSTSIGIDDHQHDEAATKRRRPRGRLDRIFVIVHHKEIGLKVDTAKLILAAFPFRCELVVGGIGPDHQASMKKLLESVQDSNRTSLLLFPDDTAKTLEGIVAEKEDKETRRNHDDEDATGSHTTTTTTTYDLIVLDGTWAQARKFHARYFPQHDDGDSKASSSSTSSDAPSHSSSSSLQRVELSETAVRSLQEEGSVDTGHQLRRHDIPWRQVGTFEAVRLFLKDWSKEFPSSDPVPSSGGRWREPWEQIESYQRLANEAALRELGPPRLRQQAHRR